MCEYTFQNGEKCQEPAILGSPFCVLHTPFPENTEIERYQQLLKQKEDKAREKVDKGNLNFEGAILDSFEIPIHAVGHVNFTNAQLSGKLDFSKAEIKENIISRGVKISRDAIFHGAKIGKELIFDGAEIGGDVFFGGIEIGKDICFRDAEIAGTIFFGGEFDPVNNDRDSQCQDNIGGSVLFSNANISGDIIVWNTKVAGIIDFGSLSAEKFVVDKMLVGAMFDCRNAHYKEVKITNSNFRGQVHFDTVRVTQNVQFLNIANMWGLNFDNAVIEHLKINNSKVDGNCSFKSFSGSVNITNSSVSGPLNFKKSVINHIWIRNNRSIKSHWNFDEATINNQELIDSLRDCNCVSFKNTTFKHPKAQEEACRYAKKVYENLGDTIEADNYFYREMEAKRRQKLEVFRWPEYILVQLIFGYGIKPLRTFCIWFAVILTFALIYHNFQTLDPGSTFIEYVYFSTTTAMTPGFGGYKILPGWQWLALIEAFFGTFMWAAFITIFARKYMR